LRWFDALLGGGLVRGSCSLLYGAPGAGKSTLLAQVAGSVPGSLYVSLDELVTDAANLLIVDSLQLTSDGAVETAKRVVDAARATGMAVIMVCHATKAGDHAGPRLLEHLGDVTLRLDRQPRALVALKNRYGAAPVWLPLLMTEEGLKYDASGDRVSTNDNSRHRRCQRRFA
jgi:DNA repair protein RadA/Sms